MRGHGRSRRRGGTWRRWRDQRGPLLIGAGAAVVLSVRRGLDAERVRAFDAGWSGHVVARRPPPRRARRDADRRCPRARRR